MGFRIRRFGAFAACAAGALAAFLNAAAAQTSIQHLDAQRREAVAEAARLHARANDAANDINGLDARLAAAAARGQSAEAAAAAAIARKQALEARAQALDAQYQRQREAYENAVIAAAFAARVHDRSGVEAGVFAAAAAAELEADLARSAEAIADAKSMTAALETERTELASAQVAVAAEQSGLRQLISARREDRAALNRNAAAAELRARRYAAEAQTLQELARRTQAARRSASHNGAATLPASWLAPAPGDLVRNFGEHVGAAAPAQGATLRTHPGQSVIAPAAAEVAYAGPFRSYGQVVILNLDDGYALVLTGLQSVRVAVGASVTPGEIVGEMPASAASAPELYVEVRRNGRALDPGRWLARGASIAAAQERAG